MCVCAKIVELSAVFECVRKNGERNAHGWEPRCPRLFSSFLHPLSISSALLSFVPLRNNSFVPLCPPAWCASFFPVCSHVVQFRCHTPLCVKLGMGGTKANKAEHSQRKQKERPTEEEKKEEEWRDSREAERERETQ